MSYSFGAGPVGLGEAAPLAASELGQIRTKDGYRYQVTPEDVLWLARSVQFEGGDHASTIWTYAQLQAKRRRSSSLAALVRAHSQPINPLWDEATDAKCQQHADRCTPEMLERRRVARTTPWGSLRAGVRDMVLRWARAELPNPVPRSVDFADPAVSRSFINRNPGTQVVLAAGNWYLATPDVLSWPADFVTMAFEGRETAAAAGGQVLAVGVGVGAAALAVTAAFAGWAYWKYGRRR
jgi:hypothetical protein